MTKNFTHERSLHVKRYLVLVLAVLMATVLLAAGCGGGGTSISGKYIYKAAPAGQGPVLDFKSNGTVAISVPAQVNPQTNQPTPAQNLNWYYETSSDLVKMWKTKGSTTSSAPTDFLLIYKDTLVDGQGQVMVKQGTATAPSPATSPSPTSPTPSTTP
jgi:hypothetical protein